MRVVIAGGHGQIARQLSRRLAAAGHQPVGIIRKPEHEADLAVDGATAVVLDLEQSDVDALARVLTGADAAVFAAGAGPGSGVQRKDTVDRAAAVAFADAAVRTGVRRFLQVSAMGLDRAEDPETDEVFAAYLRAKRAAEDDLRSRELDWTILRPGRLTDDPAADAVRLAESVPAGEIPRDDVAAVLAELLVTGAGGRTVLELVAGRDSVAAAVAGL